MLSAFCSFFFSNRCFSPRRFRCENNRSSRYMVTVLPSDILYYYWSLPSISPSSYKPQFARPVTSASTTDITTWCKLLVRRLQSTDQYPDRSDCRQHGYETFYILCLHPADDFYRLLALLYERYPLMVWRTGSLRPSLPFCL
jgi:hypothetical protein